MGTLRRATELTGYSIRATDGDIGEAREFYFDDSTWAIRYLVVDAGGWLLHRNVLISPQALGAPDATHRVLPVAVTKEQVRRSPRTVTDKPIALQYQALLHRHYGWDFYLGGEALIGSDDSRAFSSREPVNAGGKPFDPHLRTTRVVAGHSAHATDGHAGRVRDFLLDDESWFIRFLVVRLSDGKEVAVPVPWVSSIDLERSTVYLDTSLERISACETVTARILPAA